MSLLFNTLFRSVLAFLPRSKHRLISSLQSPSSVTLEPQNRKSVTASTISPSICHEVMGPDAMIFVFYTLNFKPLFHSPLSPSSRGSLVPLCFLPLEWYRLHIWSCLYFPGQSWFLHVLHPAQQFVGCTLHVKLNRQGDNIQPWNTSSPIMNQSVVLCLVLTVAPWPAYRFLRRQVRWSSTPISLRKFYSLLWSIWSKALV